MKRALPCFALIAALGAGAAAPLPPDAIRPGYWETTSGLISPIRQLKTERRCIKPADVPKYMTGPSNKLYTCTYPVNVFKNGVVTLKGTCISKNGRHVTVEGSGVYSPTSMRLEAVVRTKLAGIPVAPRFMTEARRIGDECPKPADPA